MTSIATDKSMLLRARGHRLLRDGARVFIAFQTRVFGLWSDLNGSHEVKKLWFSNWI